MQTVRLPGGKHVPALGQGTWYMGSTPARRQQELAALRCGLDLGLTLIDTAEIYGDGDAERLVAEAIAGRRDEVFLVTKVAPRHAGRTGTLTACEASLKRLGTDYIDLYLLHWPDGAPVAETLDAFLDLQAQGKIRHYGVSNFARADLAALATHAAGNGIAADQLHYNLARRGVEAETLPWLRGRGIPIMAYSPLDRADLVTDPRLTSFARDNGMTPAQAALAWLLAAEDIVVIPKAAHAERVRENAAAIARSLSVEQLSELSRLFPAARRKPYTRAAQTLRQMRDGSNALSGGVPEAPKRSLHY